MTEEQAKLIGRELRHFNGNLYRLMGNVVAKAFTCGKDLE